MESVNGNLLLIVDGADTYTLRKTLFGEYGASDRRIKKIEKAIHFRVDECEIYTGADGKPLSHVCTIYALVNDDGSLKVSLCGNVPLETPVQRWIEFIGVGCGASSNCSEIPRRAAISLFTSPSANILSTSVSREVISSDNSSSTSAN